MTSLLTELPGDFTRLIELTGGHYDLTVWVRADVDLDSTFEAICDVTGDRLSVNGWLFRAA